MKTTSQVLREFLDLMVEAWDRYGGLPDTEDARPEREAMRLVREAAEQKQREGD